MFTLSGYILIMRPEGLFVVPTPKHHTSPNTELTYYPDCYEWP